MVLFKTIILMVFIMAVCYCDIRYKKIYNWLTLPFLILSVVINIYISGVHGLLISILGLLTGFFMLLIPFILRWVGAGDVKFLAAAGSLVGYKVIFHSTLLGLILFGIAASIYLIIHKRFKTFFMELYLTLFAFKGKGAGIIQTTGSLPMGVFLGIGIIIYWLNLTFYL